MCVDGLTDVFKNLMNNCGKTKAVKAFSIAHGGFSTSFSQVFKHFAHTRLDLIQQQIFKRSDAGERGEFEAHCYLNTLPRSLAGLVHSVLMRPIAFSLEIRYSTYF